MLIKVQQILAERGNGMTNVKKTNLYFKYNVYEC